MTRYFELTDDSAELFIFLFYFCFRRAVPTITFRFSILFSHLCLFSFGGRELDERSAYRYRRLGSLSVDVWQRFFNTEYVEVIFRGILADEVHTLLLWLLDCSILRHTCDFAVI